MVFDLNNILSFNKEFRVNLINSIIGIKPANVIGTESKFGVSNLAIFSSIVHLGSNPPLIGFILRPEKRRISDTMENILGLKYYTINHINSSIIKQCHNTSEKLDSSISEFEIFNIEKEYIKDFSAPFVQNSFIKIGLKLKERLDIKINNTALIIGEIQLIKIQKDLIGEYGHIDLQSAESVGIGGLDTYYNINKKIRLPYV